MTGYALFDPSGWFRDDGVYTTLQGAQDAGVKVARKMWPEGCLEGGWVQCGAHWRLYPKGVGGGEHLRILEFESRGVIE